MFKYLYCMMVLLFLSAAAAFTRGNRVIKALALVLFLILAMWIGSMRVYFLPVLLIPVLVAVIKAHIDYTDWYLL
jgi:hypothetical protein